ncbi:putative Zn-binding protein involved in type VI secretion [Pseudomonas sp. JUb42]|nr:putative Zn-binding protein involved in type VI secretion [Pseudomonas sp. JUb42]
MSASASHLVDLQRVARMGDPVWCAACQSVGYIAQGNPTFVDEFVAVSTHGNAVKCACKPGSHTVIATQEALCADMEATIEIPEDLAEKAQKEAERINRDIREGTFNPTTLSPFCQKV